MLASPFFTFTVTSFRNVGLADSNLTLVVGYMTTPPCLFIPCGSSDFSVVTQNADVELVPQGSSLEAGGNSVASVTYDVLNYLPLYFYFAVYVEASLSSFC